MRCGIHCRGSNLVRGLPFDRQGVVALVRFRSARPCAARSETKFGPRVGGARRVGSNGEEELKRGRDRVGELLQTFGQAEAELELRRRQRPIATASNPCALNYDGRSDRSSSAIKAAVPQRGRRGLATLRSMSVYALKLTSRSLQDRRIVM